MIMARSEILCRTNASALMELSNLGRLTMDNVLRNLHGGENWLARHFHSSFVPDSDQHRPNAHPVAIVKDSKLAICASLSTGVKRTDSCTTLMCGQGPYGRL
jgi:hypothetical protein